MACAAEFTRLLRVALLAPLCCLIACSSKHLPSDTMAAQAPVAVEIGKSFVHEGMLNVEVFVDVYTSLSASNVAVHLRGLKEGTTVEERLLTAADVQDREQLAAGNRVKFLFQLPANRIEEYQVALSWGEKPMDNVNKKQSEGALILASSRIEETPVECANSPCAKLATVFATLRNTSEKIISGATLGLGLYWVDHGNIPIFPSEGSPLTANEELITLEELGLQGSEEKAIRVHVDRALPQLPGGSVIPHLRLVEYR